MELFLKVVWGAECWRYDSSLLPLPWRDPPPPLAPPSGALASPSPSPAAKAKAGPGWSGKQGKLRIGIMWDDGHVRPVEACQRAMRTVVDALGSEGAGKEVELVDVEPKYFAEGWKLTVRPHRRPPSSSLETMADD